MTAAHIAQAMVLAQSRLQFVDDYERNRQRIVAAGMVPLTVDEVANHRSQHVAALESAERCLTRFEPANDCAFHPEPVPA